MSVPVNQNIVTNQKQCVIKGKNKVKCEGTGIQYTLEITTHLKVVK